MQTVWLPLDLSAISQSAGYGQCGIRLIAASLAELTDGLIDSSDAAWDKARLPATADEFLTWYMRPELALEANYATWAARCIARLRTDFGV